MSSSFAQHAALLALFASVFLLMQLAIGQGRQALVRVSGTNHRLRLMGRDDPQAKVLARIRRERGLDERGQLGEAWRWLGKVVLHSGVRKLQAWMVPPLCVLSAAVFAFALWEWKETAGLAALGGAVGFAFPVLVLLKLGKRRRLKAVSQLPDALDVVVRSLKAGHPVPVALRLVAREMPDPLGTEFGVAVDEIGFGASVPQAVQRAAERVDHEDMFLFAAMIRLQDKTGGNLVSLLTSIAETIRSRQTMRLRVKAASAEGRMSAMILNMAPVAIFVLVNIMAPDFYGSVEGHPWVKPAFWGIGVWMLIGNLVMRRMIAFRI